MKWPALVVFAFASLGFGQGNPSLWYTVDDTISHYNGLTYCVSASQVTAGAGLLTETVASGSFTCQSTSQTHVTGAMVSTPFYMTYGRVSVIAKFAPTGVHSVLWMWGGAPGTSGYPPTCVASIKAKTSVYQTACTADSNTAYEIDFGEYMPAASGSGITKVSQGIHTWVNNVRADPFNGYYDAGVDVSQAFHNYEIIWTPTNLIWRFDGKITRVFNIPPGGTTWNQPMYLIVDTWYDAFGGLSGAYPLSFQVKSVQAWDSNNKLIFSDTFGAGAKGALSGRATLKGPAIVE